MIAWLALPLEVLPGWPEPEQYSNVFLLTLTVLGPLALFLVFVAIAWGPKLMKRSRAEAHAEGIALDTQPEHDSAAIAADATPARRALDS